MALVESCEFTQIPLSALSFKTRDLISRELDKNKVLPSPEGLPRDYRGLAQIARVSSNDIRNPTLGVISLWMQCQTKPSFQDLIDALCRLDRWDIFDDVQPSLKADASDFSIKTNQISIQPSCVEPSTSDHFDHILTYDDSYLVNNGLPPNQRYDAYLLYAEQDEDKAREVVNTLEAPPYRLKLCLKDRDLLPGVGFAHVAITNLITERCNKVIVVFTSNFINCPAERFFYEYSMALQLNERERKIVPCIFEWRADNKLNQKLLRILYSTYAVNFARPNPFRNSWDLLCTAISTPGSNQPRCLEANKPSSEVISQSSSCNNERLNGYDIKTMPYPEKSVPATTSPQSQGVSDTSKQLVVDESSTNSPLNSSCALLDSECSSANSTALLLPNSQNKGQTVMDKFKKKIKKMDIAKAFTSKEKKKKKKGKAAVALP